MDLHAGHCFVYNEISPINAMASTVINHEIWQPRIRKTSFSIVEALFDKLFSYT